MITDVPLNFIFIAWDTLKTVTSFARYKCSLKSLQIMFPFGCRTEVVTHSVVMCRKSRLSCIYLPNSVTMWCRTLWCYYYYWGGACKVEHQLGPWQLVPLARLCHFLQQQLVQKIWPRKQHLSLLVRHLLKQGSGDWSGTLSDELCSYHCLLAYFYPSRSFPRFSLMLLVARSTDFMENYW